MTHISTQEIESIVCGCPLPDGVETMVYETNPSGGGRTEYPGGPPLVVVQLRIMFPEDERRYVVTSYAADHGSNADILANGGTTVRMSDQKRIAALVENMVQAIYRESQRRSERGESHNAAWIRPKLHADDAFKYTPPV